MSPSHDTRPQTPRSAVVAPSTPPSKQRKTLQKSPPTAASTRLSLFKRRSHMTDDHRRDSGMAPSLATAEPIPPHPEHTDDAALPQLPAPVGAGPLEVPSIVVQNEEGASTPTVHDETRDSADIQNSPRSEGTHEPGPASPDPVPPTLDAPFEGLDMAIETGDFADPFDAKDLSFSKRGSVLMSGKRLSALVGRSRPVSQTTVPEDNTLAATPTAEPEQPSMSPDERRISKRVRSMYEAVDGNLSEMLSRIGGPDDEADSAAKLSITSEASLQRPDTQDSSHVESRETAAAGAPSIISSRRSSVARREAYEVAGGIEDLKDVGYDEVDRYGFIKPHPRASYQSIPSSVGTPEQSHRSNRSPAALATVDEGGSANAAVTASPDPSGSAHIPRFSSSPSFKRVSPSMRSNRSRRSSTSLVLLRPSSQDANRGRRWADEAGDMLVLGPSMAVGPYEADQDRDSASKAAVERRREAKWAKMARPMAAGASVALGTPERPKTAIGGGQSLYFDLAEPKLVSRTWKGIPDRWRASAWYSFLLTSAQQSEAFVPDVQLIETFHRLQERDCADDGQIDMDVPRTISGHVMFRRRYRGGQRLLFRVLRALAQHFGEIGYTQGMAPLVATLLCYYDEERAFVMAVRMWQFRGVAELYRAGFQGLMDALEGLEQGGWLGGVANGRVKITLDELGIASSAYGTKWYLTLFSYSMPFAAQVRVWDVLMLLGGGRPTGQADFAVLHAVSAALLDGLQEQLVGAEFETAMRLLTTAVPVGREDVLMRMAKKEYKLRQVVAKGGR